MPNLREPILHLAKRGAKQPELLKAGEAKRLSEWVILAFRRHQRESSRVAGEVINNTDNILESNP